MNLMDRILLVVYTVCSAAIAILLFLIPFNDINFILTRNVIYYLEMLKNNYILSIIGFAFLLISLRFLALALKRNVLKESYLVKNTDYGEVKISSHTITGLVENVANKFSGIDDIESKVRIEDGSLFIYVKGSVQPEINIPEISTELQNKIKNNVEKCTGTNINDIQIKIASVTTPTRNVK